MSRRALTRADLQRLLGIACRADAEDLETILRIAVKASLAAEIGIADPLREALDVVQPKAGELKRLFRMLARFDRLDALASLLIHPSADVRLAVVHAFYNYGVVADEARLDPALNDDDIRVRVRAEEALEVIRRADRPRPREALDSALTADELLIAGLLLASLQISDVAPAARLLASSDGTARRVARQALRTTEGAGLVVIDSVEQLTRSGASLNPEAVGALQDVADGRAIALLIRSLRMTDRPGRQAVSEALVSLGPKAVAPLLDAFEHDADIRRQEGELVARVAGAAALDALLSALESAYTSVRRSAAEGLRQLGSAAVPELVVRLERADRDQAAAILDILAPVGAPQALESILARVRDAEPSVRAAAITALGPFDETEAMSAVASAATSPHWQVRRAAARALGRRPWSNLEAARLLREALHDTAAAVRSAAAHSVRELARGFSIESIEPLIRVVAGESEPEGERARATLEALRAVVAFSMAEPRASSPEGSMRRQRIVNALRAHVDLRGDEAIAAGYHARRPVGPPAESQHESTAVAPITDAVQFSVLSPLTVTAGKPCLVDVWAHYGDLDSVLQQMRRDPSWRAGIGVRSKGPVGVTRGTTLRARLAVPSLGWEDEDTIAWTGTAGNATYSLRVPADAERGDHAGQLLVYVADLPLARVAFLISVGASETPVQDVTVGQRFVNSAFASYATEDRDQVLARIQGMQQIVPQLDIFMDVVSLRSGERWEERLDAEILERDVLYLFWSRAAGASPWVDKEWRTAYRARGLDGIQPVPLETPELAPAPPELAGLHFSDWTLQFRSPPHS